MTVENEEPTDDQLFNDAVSDEPAEVLEQPAAEIEQPEPLAAEVTEPTAEKPAVDDNAPLVPSWRLREINEEKRTLADKVAALEAERLQWQRPQQVTPIKEPEKVTKPDPLLDPDGFEKHIEAKVEARLLNDRREESLLRARDANQQEFDEAYAAAQKVVDPALKARMQSSRDPGKTLLDWHREQKTRQEIGGDLTAYKQRLREEALKDPEFRKAAMAAWRDESQPQQTNGRPRVELPPSLNGASRSNAALKSADLDVSDHELFEQITG